ncbi:MAG: hypothetical protein JWP59_4787 [Massilia sp.]|nr:hypothetical protein [Massilia sp.]
MTHRTARRAAAGLVCAAVVALSGCGGEESGDDPSADNDSAPTSPEQSSEAPSETAAPASATCNLKGKSGGTATLEQTSDGLVMTFAGLPVPDTGTALYSVSAYDAAGEQGGQFGVKYQDGEQIAFFVFDFGTVEQTNLDGEAETSTDGITATAADADLGPLSGVEVGSWSATYNVNGNDVGTCPGGIDSLPFPG